MFKLNDFNLLLETVYPGRKTGVPLLSVSPSSANLNTAFYKTYEGGPLYYQLGNIQGKNYLLISKDQKPAFYKASDTNKKGYTLNSKKMKELLGKSNRTIRYTLTKEQSSDNSLMIYRLDNYIEDLVKTSLISK